LIILANLVGEHQVQVILIPTLLFRQVLLQIAKHLYILWASEIRQEALPAGLLAEVEVVLLELDRGVETP